MSFVLPCIVMYGRQTSFATCGEVHLRYASKMKPGSWWTGPWLGAIMSKSSGSSFLMLFMIAARNGIIISA